MENSVRPILLIEGRAVDLDLTTRMFTRHNVINPIQTARDGDEALTLLQRWEEGEPQPVIILLDPKLPKISGLTFLREIKRHPRFCTIPIVLLAGSMDDLELKEAHQLGCDTYIVKPIEFSEFAAVAPQLGIYWCALNAAME